MRTCVSMAKDKWRMSEVEVPADGSCFFHSIAVAMDETIDMWYDIDELRVPMERYWDDYTAAETNESEGISSSLIRFMCAKNIDEDMLVTYNAEAQYRKHTL